MGFIDVNKYAKRGKNAYLINSKYCIMKTQFMKRIRRRKGKEQEKALTELLRFFFLLDKYFLSNNNFKRK